MMEGLRQGPFWLRWGLWGSVGKGSVDEKSKGRFLFRDLAPLLFPIFRRPGSVPRSQLIVTPEGFGSFEQSSRFPYSSVIPFAARAFLGSCRSIQFPECFASLVADSPGVPLPVLPMALVCSLLLEDFSSVDLKDTRDLPEMHRARELFFCGNSADFVEIPRSPRYRKTVIRMACRGVAAEW